MLRAFKNIIYVHLWCIVICNRHIHKKVILELNDLLNQMVSLECSYCQCKKLIIISLNDILTHDDRCNVMFYGYQSVGLYWPFVRCAFSHLPKLESQVFLTLSSRTFWKKCSFLIWVIDFNDKEKIQKHN